MSRSHPTSALETKLEELYGQGIDWRPETGVVHVTAIGSHPRAAIAVGPLAPRSRTDRFVLGFARARADVIVTTGAILRAEPELVHRTSEDPDEAQAWQCWRADRLERRSSPQLLVLTAGGEIPLDHPALRASPHPIVWTTEAGRQRLAARGARLELVVDDDRSPLQGGAKRAPGPASPVTALSAAIRGLRGRVDVETIVVEAGPRSTHGLYAEAAGVDELLLSVFMGDSFPAVPGPALPATECLAAHFSRAAPQSRVRVEEAGGAWLFERYRRP